MSEFRFIRRPLLAGDPQGSLLSPMLHNIFFRDIADPLLAYADDMLLVWMRSVCILLNDAQS